MTTVLIAAIAAGVGFLLGCVAGAYLIEMSRRKGRHR